MDLSEVVRLRDMLTELRPTEDEKARCDEIKDVANEIKELFEGG